MNVTEWIRTWLSMHPLKEPPAHDPAQFTREVMERVHAGCQPRRVWAPLQGFSWPRVGLVVASVAAGLLLMVTVTKQSEGPRTVILAESQPSDEEWLTQTLQLLEQLDEDESLPLDDSELSDDEDWLEELEYFDQIESASSS